ncbi:MAG: diaminopimelate decarboxylase [Clostridiales bacterium]|nr:diaminopimelate decarboxylase [Clostridiales bacterium]
MDKQRLSAIAQEFGTPSFVFDEGALACRMHEIKQIVGDDVHLCYSIKANPFLIPAMQSLVELLEVCSPGELEICESLHVDPRTVLFSGVNKTLADIEHAMDAGVVRFTAESPLHIRLLHQAAAKRGVVYPVLLRLTAGSQFGMDERDLLSAIAHRADYPYLRFEGIHYFSGTQRAKLDKDQRKELAMLGDFMDRLEREYGFVCEKIEYGPGLYFPYFAHEDHSDTLAPIRALAPDLQKLAERCELTIEMGRFFASECGTYLTTVIDAKVNCGHNYAIVDGGIHHVNYLGGTMGMRNPIITHIAGPEHTDEAEADWSLCGSLCTTADILVRKIAMSGLAQQDVLAFHNIGAYSVTEGPALFLSRNMPRIILANESGARLVRDTIHSSAINQSNIK